MAGSLRPKQIAQEGASDNQVLSWSTANGVWEPRTITDGPNFAQDIVAGENVSGTDTVLTATLSQTPVSNASVVATLNGQTIPQGAGNYYSVSGVNITWLGATGTAIDLDTSDELIFSYAY